MTPDGPQTWFRRGAAAFVAADCGADELVPTAHRTADRSIAQSPERAERQCALGCTACCHFRVGIVVAEAVHLHQRLEQHPRREALRARITARAAEGPSENTVRRPCALLEADGRCAVYVDRPLACRGWHSKDRLGCENEHQGLSGTRPRPDAAAYYMTLGVAHELERRSGSAHQGPLELHAALAALHAAGGDPAALPQP